MGDGAMIAIPAVDLRDGACVQLVGGSYADERIRLPDPASVAQRWAELGFAHLHVVDLDAATGCGSNAPIVRRILRRGAGPEVQIGGGITSEGCIRTLVRDGAARIIVGTRAIEDPPWIAEMAARFPNRLIVAADARGGQVVTRGWSRVLPAHVLESVEALHGLPLAGILVTAVHREGRLQGPDLPLMESVVNRAPAPVYAAGGIASLADLQALAAIGVTATVIGMALYTGALDPRAVVTEFSQ
jgi:phosphoribosylformimino-5-aminoimidazole carboxamide ribotide isomerase